MIPKEKRVKIIAALKDNPKLHRLLGKLAA
jgi:hypothetical protein